MTVYRNEQVTVAEMRSGGAGTVVEVAGGRGLIQRLDAMGIRPGRKVIKMSSTPFHGPVTLRVDNAQVAVGYGMAKKIVVMVDDSPPGDS